MDVTASTNKYYIERSLDFFLYLDRISLKLLKDIFAIKIKHRIVSKLTDLIWNEIIEIRKLYPDIENFEFDIKDFIDYQEFLKEWQREQTLIDSGDYGI
ncbi:hypothetical protein ABNX05_11370 [Lysinibacillus sp. M3]|uniref:Uncharacterized protein n=1 Tax=Lysinibacillus zambalensis TaxID=3160866 RepID=A0ABV1MVE5_9BACI